MILDETAELLRADRGRLICRTHHGFVCANAGVDASNARRAGRASSCCPRDPDASARARCARGLGVAPAVDHRLLRAAPGAMGQCEVAIGCAGLAPLDDWRGRRRPRRAASSPPP